MTFLEKHLQTTQADTQRDDAGVVGTFEQFPVCRFPFQAIHQAGNHDQPRRYVDVEDVFPAPVFREPAAQCRAYGGGERGGHGKHGHAFGAMMLGQLDQGQGERQRDQCTAGEALQGSEHDHAFQAPGHGAKQRRDKKPQRHPNGQAPCR
ncbi:hypothetical protein D3C73_1105220 [compost metagenome]